MTSVRSSRLRLAAALLPALLLLLLPTTATEVLAKSAKRAKSAKTSKRKQPAKSREKPVASPSGAATTADAQGPCNWGEVRSMYARRGGLRADSNPTTIPVVDGDFLWMAEVTRGQIMAREAQRISRGGGVLVAVLDGGFDLDHPDVAGRVLPWGYDALDQDFDPQDLGNGYDDDGDGRRDRGVGHGTFVSGMILLAAPDATILPIRVRDDEGWGTAEELERGLRFAFEMGARVVNVSGEAPHGGAQHIRMLIAEMRARGVVIVNSAGNEGLDEIPDLGFPGDVLSVGAVDWSDKVADFSNSSLDPGRRLVFAPGVDLYGPLGVGGWASSGYWSGTSFSAGLVSGAAALVRAQEPWLPTEAVFERLLRAVDPVVSAKGLPAPHGRINLWKAVWQ